MNAKLVSAAAFTVCLILLSLSGSLAQVRPHSISELRYAFEAWKLAQNKYENAKKLVKEGVISKFQLEEYRIDVLHKKTVLDGFLNDALGPFMEPILEKVYTRRNVEEMDLVVVMSVPPLPPSLHFLKESVKPGIEQLYIQIEKKEKIITRPLERVIHFFPAGSSKTLVYHLLDPSVNEIDVHLKWGSSTKTYHVPIERKEPLVIRSETDQQEAILGQAVSFALTFDNRSHSYNSVEVKVLDLPPSIEYAFRTAHDGARVTRFTFPEGQTEYHLKLVLKLPPEPGPNWDIDVPLPFTVIAKPSNGKVARLPLSIIPRGKAILSLAPAELFRRVKTGEAFELPVIVQNKGTRRATHIRYRGDLPRGWLWQTKTDKLGAIEPNGEKRINLQIMVPTDTGVGDFIVRLWAEGLSGTHSIKSAPVDVRIQVESSRSMVSMLFLLIIALIGIGSAILVYKWASR